MKLRILGNSIRFRLGRAEVEAFGRSCTIKETVRFGKSNESDFRYELQIVDGHEFTGRFSNGTITVSVPRLIAEEWTANDEVSISGKQRLDKEILLKFLIEKDFVCLSPRNDEDQSDRYPHPNGDDAC